MATVWARERRQSWYSRRPVDDAVCAVVVEQVLADISVWVVQFVLPPWPVHRRDDLAGL